MVYCDTGSLGGSAARQLAAQGFTKAVNLRGGLAGVARRELPARRKRLNAMPGEVVMYATGWCRLTARGRGGCCSRRT